LRPSGAVPQMGEALWSTRLSEYRFFIWTEADGKIAKVEVIDQGDDTQAIGWADQAFVYNPLYTIIEIWKGDCLVERRHRDIDA
jgi:hypothetical protein